MGWDWMGQDRLGSTRSAASAAKPRPTAVRPPRGAMLRSPRSERDCGSSIASSGAPSCETTGNALYIAGTKSLTHFAPMVANAAQMTMSRTSKPRQTLKQTLDIHSTVVGNTFRDSVSLISEVLGDFVLRPYFHLHSPPHRRARLGPSVPSVFSSPERPLSTQDKLLLLLLLLNLHIWRCCYMNTTI